MQVRDRWKSGGVRGRALPARKVFHDFDDVPTSPDAALFNAFEETRPGPPDLVIGVVVDDEPTRPGWAWPALGALILGCLVGGWWGRRRTRTQASSQTAVAGDESGLHMLGAA